jgi:hypothetical protein
MRSSTMMKMEQITTRIIISVHHVSNIQELNLASTRTGGRAHNNQGYIIQEE